MNRPEPFETHMAVCTKHESLQKFPPGISGFNLILKEKKLDESVGRFSFSCARGNIFEDFSFLFFAGSDFLGSA